MIGRICVGDVSGLKSLTETVGITERSTSSRFEILERAKADDGRDGIRHVGGDHGWRKPWVCLQSASPSGGEKLKEAYTKALKSPVCYLSWAGQEEDKKPVGSGVRSM